MPELLLIDGGKNQVNAVGQVLLALGVDIPIAGMVKDEKHRTRGIVYRGEEKRTQKASPFCIATFLGFKMKCIALQLNIIEGKEQKLQKSELDEIPGIGEKRKQILFKTFGSIEAIATAEMEALRSLRDESGCSRSCEKTSE